MFLIDAEDDGLGVPVRLPEVLGQVSGDGLGAGVDGDRPLEVLRAVVAVGNLPVELVLLPLVRSPPCSVECGEDAVNPVRGQETVLDAPLEGVGVERVAEVGLAIFDN